MFEPASNRSELEAYPEHSGRGRGDHQRRAIYTSRVDPAGTLCRYAGGSCRNPGDGRASTTARIQGTVFFRCSVGGGPGQHATSGTARRRDRGGNHHLSGNRHVAGKPHDATNRYPPANRNTTANRHPRQHCDSAAYCGAFTHSHSHLC